FFLGESTLTMDLFGIGLPQVCDLAWWFTFVKAQVQQFNPQLSGFSFFPGAFLKEETGRAEQLRRPDAIKLRGRSIFCYFQVVEPCLGRSLQLAFAINLGLDAPGYVPYDPVQETPEVAPLIGIVAFQDTVLLQTFDKDILDCVIEFTKEVRVFAPLV